MTTTARQPKPKPANDAVEFIRELAKGFTKHHRDLQIDGAELPSRNVLTIQAHKADHPRLVGTQGVNIRALQTLIAAFGEKAAKLHTLTLLDPRVGQREESQPFAPDPKWKPKATMDRLRRTLDATMPCAYTIAHADVGELTTFEVVPAENALPLIERGDYARALHVIFHAIGKNEGRQIHVEVQGAPANGSEPHV